MTSCGLVGCSCAYRASLGQVVHGEVSVVFGSGQGSRRMVADEPVSVAVGAVFVVEKVAFEVVDLFLSYPPVLAAVFGSVVPPIFCPSHHSPVLYHVSALSFPAR